MNRAEYAIAGSYREFMEWRALDVKARRNVIFLGSVERAESLAVWAPKGLLHRIGTWETSPAKAGAERLELVEPMAEFATIACPTCSTRTQTEMPQNASLRFFNCPTRLSPKPGDCCVFCSYGTARARRKSAPAPAPAPEPAPRPTPESGAPAAPAPQGSDADGEPGSAEAAERVPTSRPDDDLAVRPTFTPYTVAPSILNRDEIVRAMVEAYPALLRDAGIGGTVRVYLFIDESGQVRDTRIHRSSGHQALDDAALGVARLYRFSPALNRDRPVPVWVSFPITFQVR